MTLESSFVHPAVRSPSGERVARHAYLQALIERAAQLLPAQGPITAFVFLNTLQSLEDLPFDEGVVKGARLFGCQPYLAESRYREKLAQGRIRYDDLAAVLRDDLGPLANVRLCPVATRFALRMAMLQHPLRIATPAELRWTVAETDALMRVRPESAPAVRRYVIEETRRWLACALAGQSAQYARQPFQPCSYVAASVSAGQPCPSGSADCTISESARQPPWPTKAECRQPGTADLRSLLADLISRCSRSSSESWSEAEWEALAMQALWRVCWLGVHGIEMGLAPAPAGARHRDVLLEATREDCDSLVHEVLIRFCAAFADQGLAHWRLPGRDRGLYRAFFELYRNPSGPPNRWLQGLPAEIARLERAGLESLESILESLELLGLIEDEWDDYITATLLALRGWAGLIRQMEVRPDRVALPAQPGTLVEFLAVRLILERLALEYVGRQSLGYQGSLGGLRDVARTMIARRDSASVEQRAFLVFQIAQIVGWTPETLSRLSQSQWSALVGEIEAFPAIERRRVFHLAFERRFRNQALDAIGQRGRVPPQGVLSPRFQAVFCIDAREESFRRQLEEFAPRTETFGAAGFFSVPMYFRGVADAHFSALCPIVVQPQHWVAEDVVYTLEESHRRRARTRRAVGSASHQVHVGSRGLGTGAVLAAGLGVLASVPLVARVLFPRLTARIRRTAGRLVSPPPITRLRIERTAEPPGPEAGRVGFSLDEMAAISERVLRDIGLVDTFARLVLFIGHGSFCLNNPHKSAYDCGACSGGAGGPNARALAAMLNDHRVRERLAQRGLAIPGTTLFLGGLHNTCSDTIAFFDLDLLPKSHVADFEDARETLNCVCERNAHERCRRFESAPLDLTFVAARLHVEARAEDLAQTRPEYGNATNALCVVGRRGRTRGLFLDRRAFLISYDPARDDADGTILARILGAVVPVCEGINLQYFFSAIDSAGWGAGTKLPHNVTSLLGVMDGAASDLRTGLPWQGVEIHEPLRLLFVIETTPRAVLTIMEKNEIVGRIFRNGWAQLALLDPASAAILLFRKGGFEPYRPESDHLPQSSSSLDWYRGRRDHLPFAAVGRTCPQDPPAIRSEGERCSQARF